MRDTTNIPSATPGVRRLPRSDPRLRLAASEGDRPLDEVLARRAVEEENRRAAGPSISPTDLRHALAERASAALEGGRAALLRAERRRWLIDDAARRGLSPFEANLVIAIVQDAARRGEDPRSGATIGRLGAVPPRAGAPVGERWFWVRVWLASAALAALLLNAMIGWVTAV
ncbi:MAG TPA: hypothetical protein DEB06_05995 [Phycisphaerales bacterium]|nr:hypothetical protein [Phycisphaerales bacterium]